MAQSSEGAAQAGLFARLWREYRDDWRKPGRGFRPRWWDATVLAALLLVETTLVVMLCWHGDAIHVMIVSSAALLFVSPVLLLHLGLFWRSRWPYARVANRVTLVLLAGVLALLPLFPVGIWVEEQSVANTLRAGEETAVRLHAYRKRHDVFPRTLRELERDTSAPLARPSMVRDFRYHADTDSFGLAFNYGFMDCWEYTSSTGTWVKID